MIANEFHIEAQPDDDTCGATALHAVYRHFGDKLSLEKAIKEVHHMAEGGTLEVLLGIHALQRGYHVRLHSYNLKVFDPSWDGLPMAEIRKKLVAQTRIKDSKKLGAACLAYAHFIKEGGIISFDDPTPSLLQGYFDLGLPVLAGLSATYLYRSKREYTNTKGKSLYHDLRGKPMGHFVVLTGMKNKKVRVADPYHDNPLATGRIYEVHVGRLINSIMLGIVTYDANIMVISPKSLPA
ncbi:MAG: hypothetical protein WAT61_05260 [Flavobacteriales bacterium]|jgi:hypothetical protein|nr:peptidase-C39 like family protein [Flavobacteriales bacterium]MBP9159402.1 hypothetical protein [Flavobacteriales bacterium]